MVEPTFKSTDEGGNTVERLGQTLKYEREKQGLSVEEIAQQLHLSVVVMRNLEAGDAAALPEAVYVRGYVRAYCKLLKIDPEPLLAGLVFKSEVHEDDDFLPAMNEHVHRLTRLWGSLAVFSVLLLLVSLWWMEQPRDFQELPQTPPAEQAPVVPAPKPLFDDRQPESAPETFSGAAEQSGYTPVVDDELAEITIHSSSSSWSHLADGSGEVIINRVLFPDYRGTVYGVFPFDFRFGDARGIRIWVDGVEYDLTPHISHLHTAFFRLEKQPAQ